MQVPSFSIGRQHRTFICCGWKRYRNLEQKAIALGLWKRIGSFEFHRILRGDHKQRIADGSSYTINGGCGFLHALKQRRLGPRWGAIDFVRQQHVSEHRPRMKGEGPVGGVENAGAK